MKEIHGIADAQKLKYVGGNVATHSICIIDSEGLVKVRIETQEYAAGLTPQQARWLSKQLAAAADRIEKGTAAAKEDSKL